MRRARLADYCVTIGSRLTVATPAEYDLPYEDLELLTPDGVKIKAYLMLQQADAHKRPTVLLFHANAGNVVSRSTSTRPTRPITLIRSLMLTRFGHRVRI